jgi:hypothetical protein
VGDFECHLECAATGGALASGGSIWRERCLSRTVSCEEGQSGGVAAALQISIMGGDHQNARYHQGPWFRERNELKELR